LHYEEISLIQPIQLKKNPEVVRVVLVLNGAYDYVPSMKGNKIFIKIKKEETAEESLEDKLKNLITDNTVYENYTDKNLKDTENYMNKTPMLKTREASKENVETYDETAAKSKVKKINFNFSGMSIRDVFQTLSKITGKNIIVDGSVKDRNLNLFIQDLPVNDAIDLVVTSAGLAIHRYNDNTYIISEKDKAR
jgi:type II secretory pathway component HofQ